MHDPQSSPDELTHFEGQLAALTPRARLDRDQLMFAAGRHAGARRLRFANRLLTAASLSLAALALIVAMPRFSNDSDDQGRSPLAGEPTPAEPDAHDAPSGGITRRPVARTDGPTRLRLRRWLERGLDDPAPQRTQRAPIANVVPERPPPSQTRALLKQYLNNTPDRL